MFTIRNHPILFIIWVFVSSTVAQIDLNESRRNVEEEYQNVKNRLESIVAWRKQESPDDPSCLKPILRVGVLKIRLYMNYFERWKCREDQRYSSIRNTEKFTPDQIEEDLFFLNVTLHRLQDIHESLKIATNTIRFIKYELKPEIRKHHLEQSYDIEGELNMECDSLNGIFSSTMQLTRRLIPLDWKRTLIPPRSPIIRIKTVLKTKM